MSESNDIPTKTDTTIIGAGILGCSIFYHLSKFKNHTTTLFDKNGIASGATSLSCGTIPSYINDKKELSDLKLDKQFLLNNPSIYMNYMTVRTISEVEEARQIKTSFTQPGLLYLATNEKTKNFTYAKIYDQLEFYSSFFFQEGAIRGQVSIDAFMDRE